MPTTCTGCTVTVPILTESCGRTIEKGGIVALGFVSCSNTDIYGAPTNTTYWSDAQGSVGPNANTARVIKNVLGGLPYPSDVSKRLGSCEPESVTGRVYTLEYEDYDFTKTTSPLVETKAIFYNTIQADPSKYFLYYTECQGYTYLVPAFSLMFSAITPPNNTENKFYQVKISFQQLTMPVPFVFNLMNV